VRLISKPDQPIILPKTAKVLQNLKENMDAGKIELSLEDVQAVREVYE
jgi:hypothetical protein